MKRRMTKQRCQRKTALLLTVMILGMTGMTGCQDEKALENQQAYRQVGINKMNEGDYEGAVDAFQKALDQSKAVVGNMEIDICYYKAAAQYNSGDVEGALTTYAALIDYDKKDANAYFLRGCVYLKEGDKENAEKDYQKAFELSGNDYKLYVSAYENLNGAGYTEEAEEILKKALKLEGDSTEEHRERGHIYLLRGDYENARKELDQAINKEDVKALLYMAQVYDAQGNSKQAKALYESYIEKNGSDAIALNVLGEMQLKAENYSQALDFFQQALALENPENQQQLRRNEIVAYEYLLDFATAKEKMAAYLEDYPEDEEAQREYVFLQTR